MAKKPSADPSKPAAKKLALSRETVRDLAVGKRDVKGGAAPTTYPPTSRQTCFTATC